MGQIHASDAAIREDSQKAIILHNGTEEVLILGTDLKGDRKTGILRFIPFPSEPRITKAPEATFDILAEVMKKHRLQFLMASKGGGTEGASVELLLHEKLGFHDMTLIKVNDAAQFRAWVNTYFERKGLPTKAEYVTAEAIVDDYVKRGIPYFVLDYVEVAEETRFIEPIAYRFAGKSLYYPLKTSNTFGGKGAIELVLLLPGTLCKPSIGAYESCLGLPAFNQHVQVSTSAAVPVDDLARIYPEAEAFFGGRQVFMQMVSYWGDYSFDRDIMDDPGKAIPKAYGHAEGQPANPWLLPGEQIEVALEERSHDTPARQDPRCALQPDPGPCKGLFEKYYFDMAQGNCKKFFFGGCQGTVPFDTREACTAVCLGGQEHSDHRDGEMSR
nr:DUF2330 domain-containing protein [Desulfuromonas sp. CSMB_57]